MIISENEITGAWVRARREALGMSQTEFWACACVSKGMASSYENGRPMSAKVRRLIYLRHVVGIPIDGDLASIKGMAANMRKMSSASRKARMRLNMAAGMVRQVDTDIKGVILALEGNIEEGQ